MFKFTFDPQKYLEITRTQGLSKALTTLQTDISGWEYQAFEGRDGYNPEMWEELKKARDFARTLWDKG